MDEKRGERRRSWGLDAPTIRHARVADRGPVSMTPPYRCPGEEPAIVVELWKIKRSLRYVGSIS